MAEPPSVLTYIGLGSNLDLPETQVRRGIAALDRLGGCQVLAVSSLYLSQPLGPADQPAYINAVALLATRLGPHDLLLALQGIEEAHGRCRLGPRWGPRILDLDILLYGDSIIAEPDLRVPHPEMVHRAFVLAPLADLAPPNLHIPGRGRLDSLLAACPQDDIRLLASSCACEGASSLSESRPS